VNAIIDFCRETAQIGLSILIQSSLLLALALALGWILRLRGLALASLLYRSTLCAVVLTALLCIAFVGRIDPLWRVSLPPVLSSPSSETVSGVSGISSVGTLSVGNPVLSLTPSLSKESVALAQPALSPTPPLSVGRMGVVYAVAAAIWGGGMLMFLIWQGLCHLSLTRLRRRSVPIEQGRARDTIEELCCQMHLPLPSLLASSRGDSPFLTGIRHPAIVLPASHDRDFDASALRAILTHELAHLARRDCLWTLLARLGLRVLLAATAVVGAVPPAGAGQRGGVRPRGSPVGRFIAGVCAVSANAGRAVPLSAPSGGNGRTSDEISVAISPQDKLTWLRVRLVAEYFGKEGKSIHVWTSDPSESRQPPASAPPLHMPASAAIFHMPGATAVRLNAPRDAVTARYHYELEAVKQAGSQTILRDRTSSDSRTLKLSDGGKTSP
jgi:beta-lactamase regulating signal transducer with metallopeptidase domain